MNEQRIDAFKRLLGHVTSMYWLNPVFDSYEQRQWLIKYRKFLIKTYKDADFAGIADANQQTPMALTEIFVPEYFTKEDLTPREGDEDFDKVLDKTQAHEIEDLLIRFNAEEKPVDVSKKALIIGAPGSGKSALVRVLAVTCADDKRKPFGGRFGRRMVIPLILRELDVSGINTVAELLAAWARRVDIQSGQSGLIDLNHARFYLQQGWAIVAFDGVDEIGPRQRRKLRRLIYALAALYPKAALLVTGRPAGFERLAFEPPKPRLWRAIARREALTEETACPAPLPRYHLRPFSQTQIKAYAQQWYRMRYPQDRGRCQRELADLLENLNAQTALQRLQRRPIYLATLTYVNDVKGRLPNSQVKVYEVMVEAYLDILDATRRLHESKGDIPVCPVFDSLDKWRILERLAYDLHSRRIGEKNTEGDPFHLRLSVTAFKKWLKKWLEALDCPLQLGREYEQLGDEDEKNRKLELLLYFFTARAGLLVQPEEDTLMFSHLSFQEFLAGAWLFRELGNHFFDAPAFLEKNLFRYLSEDTAWHPVGLAFFSLQTQKQGGQFQEKLLEQIWLKADARPNPVQLRFLHRVQAEGEPFLTAGFRAKLWMFYWKAAVKDFGRDWLDAFAAAASCWTAWQRETRKSMQKHFEKLQGEAAENDLILFSVLPHDWLKQRWQSQSAQDMQSKWMKAKEYNHLMLALDLHAAYPQVWTFLSPKMNWELLLLTGERSELLFPLYRIQKYLKIRRYYHSTLALEALVCLYDLTYNLIEKARIRARVRVRTLFLDLAPAQDRALALARVRDQALDLTRTRTRTLARVLDRVLDRTLDRTLDWTLDWTRAPEKILLWLILQTTARITPLYYLDPQAALADLEAMGAQEPGFQALFTKEWFPYQALKKIAAAGDYRPEPIEASSHRLYRYLRHELAQAGKKVDDLPEHLKLQPGEAMRKWHGDKIADQYLRDLKQAGWDDSQWPPADVDSWLQK
ncbi:MAG: NACHT domain-containing protein [Gammaproteobacteria bacterium]|nr:NACHT domain-containing protein [Gammaproteobacteria bacterium]